MATNKIVMRSTEEFMGGFTPQYTPIMPLFLSGARQHEPVVGDVTYKKVTAVGDLRSRLITPKDTEIHQVGASSGSKNYKKFFLASQFIQSNLQDRQGYEDVVAEVLDEHNKQNDEMFLSGQVNGVQHNNGLLVSTDPNFQTRSAETIAAGATRLDLIYDAIMAEALTANETDGQKLLLYFGSTMSSQFNALFTETKTPFSSVLGESDALGQYDFIKIPSSVLPASLTNGFAIVNMGKIQVNYMMLPEVNNQGTNEEKNYAWTNFLMGSSMVDVKSPGGIIVQPLTFS